jgi:hypothetical protein
LGAPGSYIYIYSIDCQRISLEQSTPLLDPGNQRFYIFGG